MVGAERAGSRGDDSFPKLLLKNARQRGRRPAIREKDFGIWQTWTWERLLDEVQAFALGLEALGLGRGDKVAIVGSNRPRLYATFLAAQSFGAVPVPVYADAVPDEIAYVLENAEARFAVVEDQEQVDKILSVANLQRLQYVIYDDGRGLNHYDHTRMESFEAVQALGRRRTAEDAGLAERWRLSGLCHGRARRSRL